MYEFHIKKLREERGWTQGELSERSGVSRSYISEIESEVKVPCLICLGHLADAFGIKVEKTYTRL